ncbi:MAG: tRNA pseudouridine(55) synthase TruB [Fusobacteria bacterium]|nr:tRNA pseudouridine(55) synthase TruB [Fusobacteriota bacterium]
MDGFISVNKPKGITSFDIIRILRKTLKMKAIGHAGTLDPLATGVMVIAIGGATKLLQYIEAEFKEYAATLELGFETDTLDSEGEVIKRAEIPLLLDATVREILSEFLGKSTQIPPMYSAIKINGQKLYELARQNIMVERKPRAIEIFGISLVSIEESRIVFSSKVSKGTYIRTLCSDVAVKLGSVGTMVDLERTAIGSSTLAKSVTLEEIERLASKQDYSFVTSVEEKFKALEVIELSEKYYHWFLNGRPIERIGDSDLIALNYQGEFIGLGTVEKGVIIRKYVKECHA